MQQPCLFPLLRAELVRILNGYIRMAELLENVDQYVIPAQLSNHAGIAGALALAEQAFFEQQQNQLLTYVRSSIAVLPCISANFTGVTGPYDSSSGQKCAEDFE